MTNGKRFVYADNAATTRLCDEALKAILRYETEDYGNPSADYTFSDGARRALISAREEVAAALHAKADEIVFTSGGTESNNHALLGAANANVSKGKHIIASAIEHKAVMNPLKKLEKQGFIVTYLPVDGYGSVDLGALYAATRPDTALISVMAANNEIGTIQPLEKIGAFAREKGILFHTDAVQAAGHVPLDVEKMHIDLLSLSAHKFNGPKGVGALYIRRGVNVANLIEGGGQEKSRRSGTENVPGIAGLAAALRWAEENRVSEAERLRGLAGRLREGLLKIPRVRLTGHPQNRLPGLCSALIDGVDGGSVVSWLDIEGIAASAGSACSAGPSHVLLAIGFSRDEARGGLRFSLGRYNTGEDVDIILEKLPAIVEKLRMLSPDHQNNG
jgi:cysteine desulfurase